MKISFAKSIIANWELIRVFTARDIKIRYRGSYLGILWTIVNQ